MKRFVKSLPGPISYCNCVKACSDIQVDHVIPEAYLKQKIPNNPRKLQKALKDPHNMYSCCENINQRKADKMLGKDFSTGQNDPHLSRAALYMNETYELDVEEDILHKWKVMNMEMEPWDFEYERSNKIKKRNGKGNKFVGSYPTKVNLLNGASFV